MTDLTSVQDADLTRSPGTAPDHLYVRQGAGGAVLSAVRDPACVLAVWRRAVAGSFADGLDRLPSSDLPTFEAVGRASEIRPQAHAAINRSCLAGTALGRWLESDIAGLCCRYAAITGTRRMHLRLAALEGDACRYFHVDRLSFRLLCTYRGPGTQWVAPETPLNGLSGAELTTALESQRDRIHEVPARSVMLFRGHEPGAGRAGLLHRSPPARGRNGCRLLLTVSAGGCFA